MPELDTESSLTDEDINQHLCTEVARRVLHLWANACRESSGQPDRWQESGKTFRWELGKVHPSGKATGRAWRWDEDKQGWSRTTNWKISPEGRVEVAPRFLMLVPARAEQARLAEE